MFRSPFKPILGVEWWKVVPLLLIGLILLWTIGVSLMICPSPPASPTWEFKSLSWTTNVSLWLFRFGILWSIEFVVFSQDKVKYLIYGLVQNSLLFLTWGGSTIYLVTQCNLLASID